ncbi:hypothetical protein NSU_2409 [Novosphingobium pentaromativorans US6-1]|uniref:Uncharacterized protein n=1 Tax=Novosphingobium pentaromativorans US6-1 TaxID=1088721 RepID=G6EDI9_9SPHN|nr:hypothetical protein NSU_2409 [Novosphingobium pentaromativorans US6-1]
MTLNLSGIGFAILFMCRQFWMTATKKGTSMIDAELKA